MARKKKINKLNVFLGVMVIILLIALSVGIYVLVNNPDILGKQAENNEIVNSEEGENKIEEVIPEDTVINIVGIGDSLCHSQNFKDAYNSETGTYDFSPMFKNVTKYIESATVAVGNLETTLAGEERGYSGYPTFNSPAELAYDMKEMGIDILTTANNHCIDKGYSGLVSTLDKLDEYGIAHTGTSRSVEEQNTILFKDLEGIKTAFLCYTYGTNGIPIPSGREYSVNLIDKDFMKPVIVTGFIISHAQVFFYQLTSLFTKGVKASQEVGFQPMNAFISPKPCQLAFCITSSTLFQLFQRLFQRNLPF